MTLNQLVIALIINGFTSLITIVLGWDGTKYITKATSETNRTLLDFGKYTTFTLIGTNLLRSADTLIISLSPMGVLPLLFTVSLKTNRITTNSFTKFCCNGIQNVKASLHNQIDEVKAYSIPIQVR
jgi:hypothetical protein